MNFTPAERDMIRKALRAYAEEERRQAKSRVWAGERWTEFRASLRKSAAAYDNLADDDRVNAA